MAAFMAKAIAGDFAGRVDLLYPDGHVIAIGRLEQIAESEVSHIVAREVTQESNDSGEE